MGAEEKQNGSHVVERGTRKEMLAVRSRLDPQPLGHGDRLLPRTMSGPMVPLQLWFVLKSEPVLPPKVTWSQSGTSNCGLVGLSGPCCCKSHPDLCGQCVHLGCHSDPRAMFVAMALLQLKSMLMCVACVTFGAVGTKRVWWNQRVMMGQPHPSLPWESWPCLSREHYRKRPGPNTHRGSGPCTKERWPHQ